jgi:macrodomain Ter protein organizer (MatP/YcbG family)
MKISEEELIEDKTNNVLNERVKDEISRDLKRTFTAERMKTEKG